MNPYRISYTTLAKVADASPTFDDWFDEADVECGLVCATEDEE